ncbi:MAG TPA: hypothetical protein VF109_06345 [Mycobacteriales bacterium]
MVPQRVIGATRAALVAGGLALSVWGGWGAAPWWALPALALALAVTERASARMVVGRQAAAFTLNDAVMAIAFVVSPGSWIAVAAPLGYAVATVGRRPWAKLSFNLAQEFFAVAAGVLVTQALGGIGGAVAGLATFALLNHLVVAIPIAATSQVNYWRVLVAIGPLGIVHNAGNISVGVLAGWLATNSPLGLLGLVVPIGLLWWSYQQQTRRASEAQLFAELARGQERLGGSVDASTQVVVAAAGQLFGASQVELLLRHPDGLLRYVGDETGVNVRQRVDADALDAPWVLRTLAARGVIVGADAGRPYCSTVLGDPERPLAVLISHRPEKSAPFTRGDVQLAEVLAAQAESWLSVAELSAAHDEAVGRAEAYGAASRVLGDLGVETMPALAVLRESAHRLSRLATRYDGPDAVSEIVSELYSVERAVASLLGAISLASGSEPPAELSSGTQPAPSGGDAEWTTTGRLEDAVGP